MTKHQAQPYEQAECARWFHHKKIAFPDLVYASGYVLLHARRERPRERRTADERYELAPPHGLLLRGEDHAVHVEVHSVFKQALCSASQRGRAHACS
jgi:hypothetical protein